MRDLFFLRQKAEKATKGDFPVAIDLLDTLKAHEDGCVGMAANMIGVNKAIIAVNMGFMNVAMFNPKIVKRNGKYETEEGCLSLDGVRKCVRYQEIKVEYEDINFKRQRQKYSGWTAQIIQHECDHLGTALRIAGNQAFTQHFQGDIDQYGKRDAARGEVLALLRIGSA